MTHASLCFLLQVPAPIIDTQCHKCRAIASRATRMRGRFFLHSNRVRCRAIFIVSPTCVATVDRGNRSRESQSHARIHVLLISHRAFWCTQRIEKESLSRALMRRNPIARSRSASTDGRYNLDRCGCTGMEVCALRPSYMSFRHVH